MAVAEAEVRVAPPVVEEGVARKILRMLGKAPVTSPWSSSASSGSSPRLGSS